MTSPVPEPKKLTPWEEALSKLLPAGAPIPDEDDLDFSISVDFDAPPIPPSLDTDSVRLRSSSLSSASTDPPSLPPGARFNRHRSGDSRRSPMESARTSSVVQSQSGSPRASAATSPSRSAAETNTEGFTGCSAAPPRRRAACSRCGKSNFFKEREACLVCGARYCSNCVLKAMGSMPEGRKCVTCLGRPIDESRRPGLGKCSRMLAKLCSPLEVRQIMKAEQECAANQLRSEQLVVNGRPLRQDELDEMMQCTYPPRNLRPGRYWYDKDSGLWGKEGERPDRIISSQLNVGGKLRADASNGSTQVFINGREITKLELRVLKLANVQCPRDTHFWVYDDGSYEEEGQNNIRGKIWGKASTRLLCSLFSLPTPPGNSPGSKEDVSTFSNRPIPEYLEQKRVQKLLLLGLEGSGTSTIFKQTRFLYGNKFTPEELENMKLLIQSNIYKYLTTLLEGRERFEDEALEGKRSILQDEESSPGSGESGAGERISCPYSINQRLRHFSDWLLEIVGMGDLDAYFPAATREYAPVVDEVWKDPAIQETYKRRNELHFLPDVANYFLDRVIEISSNEYEPTDKDILYAEGVTQCNGLSFVEFTLDDRSSLSNPYTENFDCPPPVSKYQLIRVNSKGLSEGCRWLEMFEGVRAVIFCVALSDYDQMWSRGSDQLYNKMLASKELFNSIASHPSFRETPFVLLLNKYDAFEDKINNVPLTVCEWFSDFSPVKPHNNMNQSLASHAYYYIAVKFKDLYASICDRKLFVFQTKAYEHTTVNEAFKYIREVLKWEDVKDDAIYGIADESFYNTEMSSSPYTEQF